MKFTQNVSLTVPLKERLAEWSRRTGEAQSVAVRLALDEFLPVQPVQPVQSPSPTPSVQPNEAA